MLNKVGCPVDLYFAPPEMSPQSTSNCEKFSNHMGSLNEFIQSGQTDVNSVDSPVIHQRTYDSHSFIVRTSHDGSLVARIEIDAARVRDCPELKRSVDQLEVNAGEVVMPITGEVTNSSADLYKNFDGGLGTDISNATVFVSGVCIGGDTCGFFHGRS